MNRPEAIIDFAVYMNSKELIGIAKASLPAITFLTQTVQGAGVGGSVEAVLCGMVDAMELRLDFLSSLDGARKLASPKKHQIDLRVAEQYWNTTKAAKNLIADKYVMNIVPKSTNPGEVAPASTANTTGTYSVLYYAAYRGNTLLWEIDPFNGRCYIDGVDYGAALFKALGK